MRDILARGRNYCEKRAKGEAEVDLNLEQVRQVFGEDGIPALVHTADARDCFATVRVFYDEAHLHTVVSHAMFNGFQAAEEIVQRPVGINAGPSQNDFWFARNKKFYGLAAQFQKAGGKDISIHTDAPVVPQEELPFLAAVAVRHGLEEWSGVEGMTIAPSRQIRADDRVGSIEVGKDADLLIKAGSPFDPTMPVDMVIIRGRIVYSRCGD